MNNKQGAKSFFIIISIVIFLYVSISSVFPPLKLIPNQISILIMLSWFVTAFLINPNFFLNVTVEKVCIFLFIIYTAIVPYTFGNYVIGNRYLNLSTIFFFYIGYKFYKESKLNKYNVLMLKITSPFIAVTLMNTLYALLTNPYISRSIKSSGEYSENLWRQGIGGYDFIYFTVFLGIICFYFGFIDKNKNILYKIISIICLIFIVVSNYFTALGILVLGCFSLVVIKLFTTKNFLSLLVVIFAFIFLLLFWEQIFSGVIDIATKIIPDGKTLDRLVILQNDIANGFRSSLFSGREGINSISINSFVNNPFFGIVTNKIEYSGGYLVGFGQHSQIWDTFALFGVGIGVLQIVILVQPMTYFSKKYSEYKSVIMILLIALMALFFVNTASPSIGFVMFFIFPILLEAAQNLKRSIE